MASQLMQVIPAPRPSQLSLGVAVPTAATSVWAASGPFCSHDNLDYSELEELLMKATQSDSRPDVLVLVRSLSFRGCMRAFLVCVCCMAIFV